MKWDMEVEEIDAVLEKIWDLHDKLSDAIYSISRAHFLHSISSSLRPNKPDFTGSDDTDTRTGFVFVKGLGFPVNESAIQEAKSLNVIRTALENLEDQLEFLHMCQWILYRSSFQPDIICYNLLIDAYGQKSHYKKAESTYLELLEARCIPTEDTYALLLRAYCTAGLQEKAEAVFFEMRKNSLPPSTVVYNAYINGLIKGRNTRKAVEIYQRMKRDQCQPSTDTNTMLINLYEKAQGIFLVLLGG